MAYDPKAIIGTDPVRRHFQEIERTQEAVRRAAGLVPSVVKMASTPAFQDAIANVERVARLSRSLNLDQFAELRRSVQGLPEIMSLYKHAADLQTAVPLLAPAFSDLQRLGPLMGTRFAALPGLNVFKEAPDALGLRLASNMASITPAWLRPDAPEFSIYGFARLTGVAAQVREDSPFSDGVGEVVQEALGTGKGVDPEADPEVRDDAAVAAGLEPEIISFPEPAYAAVLQAATHRIEIIKPDPRLAHIAGVEGATINPVYQRILEAVELHLRDLVATTLASEEGGAAWVKRRVPLDIRDEWAKRRLKALEDDGVDMPLEYYSDLMHLHDVIVSGKSWPLFQPIFRNKTDFTAAMQRLPSSRNASAHVRAFSLSQAALVWLEGGRLLAAMGAARLRAA